MRLYELTVRYNEELNPVIWDGTELKPEVADKLKEIAEEFIEFLEVPELQVEDVIITGSNASFNWTEQSDIDLHVIVNMDAVRSTCEDLADDYFQDKKTIWNTQHDIKIYGQPVELYVEDVNEGNISAGKYSLMNDEWIKVPAYNPPQYDDADVLAKVEQLKYEIDKVVDAKADKDAVERLKEKIRNYRKAGLQSKGEWSVENLAFKELRNTGYLEKLRNYSRTERDDALSLK